MSIFHENLKKEVITQLSANPTLHHVLLANCIMWHTPVVNIQDILLDWKPNKSARTVTGMRDMTDAEYAPIFEKWRKNFIGGSLKLSSDCQTKTWFPPKDSLLFRLQKIEQEWNGKTFEFFILIHKDKPFFLARLSGPKNSLRVMGEEDDGPFFENSLKNVLKWKAEAE